MTACPAAAAADDPLAGAGVRRAVRLSFGAYFAYVGAAGPYLPLLYADWGLTVLQIALLSAGVQLIRIASPPVWGLVADRTGRARDLMLGGTLGMLAACVAFALLPGLPPAERFAAALAAAVLLHGAGSGVVPLTEAIAMRAAAGDAGRYGRMRVWGSIGYLVVVVGVGPILAAWGIRTLVAVLALTLCAVLLACLRLPARLERPPADGRGGGLGAFLEPLPLAQLVSGFLMLVAHGPFYAFFSLYLERLGYGTTTIGLLWGVGVVAEIVLFVVQRRLFDRYPAAVLLQVAVAAAVVRFGLTASAGGLDGAGAALLLVGCQGLHALTFGLHHSASLRVLHQTFGDERLSAATGAYLAVTFGAGGAVGALLAGVLWEWHFFSTCHSRSSGRKSPAVVRRTAKPRSASRAAKPSPKSRRWSACP